MNQENQNIKALLFDYGGTLDSGGRHWSHILREGWAVAKVDITDFDSWRDAYIYAERALDGSNIVSSKDNFLDLLKKKMSIELGRLYATESIISPRHMSPKEQAETVSRAAYYCYTYARRYVWRSIRIIHTLSEYYSIGLVTNFYGNIRAVMRNFGLWPEKMAVVVESAKVGVRKPSPEIYSMAVERLGLKPAEIIVIGDSMANDIIPATSIGCWAIWLKGEGWNASQPTDPLPEGVVTINKLDDLLPILLPAETHLKTEQPQQ